MREETETETERGIETEIEANEAIETEANELIGVKEASEGTETEANGETETEASDRRPRSRRIAAITRANRTVGVGVAALQAIGEADWTTIRGSIDSFWRVCLTKKRENGKLLNS